MKTIVTHLSPDQDAICSVWLIKRFFPGWGEAKIEFVPAGNTLNSQPPDGDLDIIHTDTGLGKFDHHQFDDPNACAATKVLAEILSRQYVRDEAEIEALKKLTTVVLEVDHAIDRLWPQPENDRYDFLLDNVLDGMKYFFKEQKKPNNQALIDYGFKTLDGVFWQLKRKTIGAKIINSGLKFDCRWGNGIGLETTIDGMHSLGERLGYKIIVQKDPTRGNARIHVHPVVKDADLTPVYERVQQADPGSDWYLHANKHLLLNGSALNPNMRPTKLKLKEIIEIIIENC